MSKRNLKISVEDIARVSSEIGSGNDFCQRLIYKLRGAFSAIGAIYFFDEISENTDISINFMVLTAGSFDISIHNTTKKEFLSLRDHLVITGSSFSYQDLYSKYGFTSIKFLVADINVTIFTTEEVEE